MFLSALSARTYKKCRLPLQISGIESGRHFPSLPTIEKISKYLDVEMKTLFDFKHLQTAKEMKNIIKSNIDKIDEQTLAFIFRFFEEYR